MADYVVQQEDGTSKIELEDGSGFVLLEQQPTGDPLRVSQGPVEVVVLPTDAKARLTQELVEVVVAPLDQKARLTQELIEVVVLPTDAKVRLTQETVEVVHRNIYEEVNIFFIDYQVP